MKNFTEYFIRYRAFAGILSVIFLLYLAQPNAISIPIGFFFIILGIFFRAWTSGFINKDKELATSGPYALTRNPLYFGNFLIGTGIAVAGNNFSSYAVFIIYFLLFFPMLMVIEHKRMRLKFGQTYENWYKKSNSFFPKIKKVSNHNFNISYYMKNKEYRVFYFSIFVVVVLILKYLLLIRNHQ